MADNSHLLFAAVVFLLVVIGVALTILEFRRGLRVSEAPYNREVGQNDSVAPQGRGSASRE